MLRAASAVLVLSLIAQSCTISTSGTWKGKDIKKEKRSEIKSLNDKLISSLKNNDKAAATSIMSDALIENSKGTIDSLIPRMSDAFSEGTYTIMDEYNVQNSSPEVKTVVDGGDSKDKGYKLHYVALNKETYASLLLVKSGHTDLLVTAIYGNYDNKWKLNILQFGPIRFFGKSAPEFYENAKDEAAKSNLVDAYDNIVLCGDCLEPANKVFAYNNLEEMQTYEQSLINQIKSKYPLPLILTNIKTQPKIFQVSPERMDEGYFPLINYLSTIDLKDTVSLKKENDEIKRETKKIFTGLADNKKYIFYRAYNEIPDGKHPVYRYGFGEVLTK